MERKQNEWDNVYSIPYTISSKIAWYVLESCNKWLWLMGIKIQLNIEYHEALNFCGRLFLRTGIFCILWEEIFATVTVWFFLLGTILCDFQEVAFNWI